MSFKVILQCMSCLQGVILNDENFGTFRCTRDIFSTRCPQCRVSNMQLLVENYPEKQNIVDATAFIKEMEHGDKK